MEAGEEKAVISFSVHRHHSASCAYGLWSRSSAIPDSTLPARSTPSTTNEVPCCAGASAQGEDVRTSPPSPCHYGRRCSGPRSAVGRHCGYCW